MVKLEKFDDLHLVYHFTVPLKDNFSPRTDPFIYFHMNSTRIIKTVKQNKLSFSSIEIN